MEHAEELIKKLFVYLFNVYLTMLSTSKGHKNNERYRVYPNIQKSLVCESNADPG
jgi:hypothetical protein